MGKGENSDPKDVQRKEKAKMQLKRNIGYFDGVSFIIGSIVGAGIFVSPTGVLKHSLLNVGVALTIWTASGLVSLMGALCYAELGTALPFSGGEYSHIKRGLGSLPAFVFIWTSTFTKPASNAARALLFAEYATQPFYGICPAPDVLKKCLALAVLWSLGILNGLSVKMAAWVQTVFTLLKMMALSVIAVGGIVLVARQKESLARFEDMFGSEIPNASHVAEAFFQGLYAYGGWWSLNYLAEEMKSPSRNIPLTVMTAVPAVIVFYLLVNISYLTVLTPKEIVSSVFSPERNEGKEGDGLRRSFRQRKAVERYESPLENLRKRKRRSSKCTSPVKEKDSCKKPKRSLSASSQKDDIKGVPNDHRKTEATRKGNLSEVHKDHIIIGASLAGVEQMQIDGSAQFHCVGGLSDHISALKEMVILPLLYPDVFEILKFKPPRGCLFYGPPGTGKTLVARALANECSRGDRKVTFFMRSAADCMSKWVGESERQLRLVFEQAYQMRPSIIFFDEIDALAPVRSSKQDQVHSSVVGTLLTLMDGLASRGEVVVIGATNRLDSIDPALRRPGRFEREFRFNLPNKEARLEIFKIHTRDWTLKPSDNLLEDLAEKCIGFCGADIKALCADAGLCALRRRYPQIHESDKRLKIDARSIKVTAKDFAMAMQKIVPASQRAGASSGRALPPISKPLLENTLERILQALQRTFPHAKLALKKNEGNDGIDSDDDSPSISEKRPYSKRAEFHTFSRNLSCQPTSFRPRFLLVGEPGCGPAFDLAPAILHALEKFPAYTLDLTNLFVSTTSQEGTCSQIKALFNTNHGEVFNIPRPTCAERKAFYENLIMKQAAEPPASKNNIGSQVHLPARCSQVDVQPQVWDKKAIKIQKRGVFVDYSELRKVLDDVVRATENVSISSMAKLYSVLSMCIYQQRENPDKTILVEVYF
ncbi:hypothetical protein DUI87_07394 [Hirundo rustica rustica]|uniref:AAA+ ATPase domain-containing protein n=1 Tax=Hirundo rustica rustica TaxID=333673 RepID=A0A3M0KWQ5_HIRRU|nr:hypothetical protein DUI87_07394 [Hirundo rustica rustica]